MKYLGCILFLTIVVITGCAQTNQQLSALPHSIYLDDQFEKDITIETPEDIFFVSKPMRNYVKTRLLPVSGTTLKAKQLIKDYFSEQEMNIGYAHDANFTASQTFEKRIANCLSLTILSYVLVKEAGLSASFIDVEIEENWNQVNGISMLNGHVNLRVFAKKQSHLTDFLDRTVTIDFVPLINIPVISSQILTKDQIIALYYNNIGGESLALGDIDKAYVYLSEATKYAPENAAIWGNLASLYRQSGHLVEAETIYNHAMKLDPNSLNLRENLAVLYKNTGRIAQANQIIDEVNKQRQLNPYYQSMLAEESYYKNEYKAAISYYKKAIRLKKTEHNFYFGLAKSYLMLNDFDNADRYLARAKSMSTENKQKQQYQSKINALNNITAKVH
ncbi:MAG: Flp pilus assembly protein TadD [Psychrosphaera sp.]|jgi:Flp pilus assembly protein TadD